MAVNNNVYFETSYELVVLYYPEKEKKTNSIVIKIKFKQVLDHKPQLLCFCLLLFTYSYSICLLLQCMFNIRTSVISLGDIIL